MRVATICVILLLGGIASTSAQTWRRLIDAPTYGFAANPQNPSTIIVGGLGRTLYRTEDAGKTWRPLYIDFPGGQSRYTNIYIHSEDTNIVLAGGAALTIDRSIDGGKNWVSSFGENNKPNFATPGETIIADPHNPNIIYTGDNHSNRVFKTRDAGITWDTVAKLDVPSLCTIAIHPDSGNILLAGASSGIILKSIDSGKTWRRTAHLRKFEDVEVARIVFSQHNPQIAYLILAYFYYKNRPSGGVYKTTDGGENWLPAGLQDTSFWTVATRKFGSRDEVFVGGFSDVLTQDTVTEILGPGLVRRSQDDGTSWVGVDKSVEWSPEGTSKNIWMMKFVGNSPETEKLYMATEKGFFVLDTPSDIDENPIDIPKNGFSASISQGMLHVHIPAEFLRSQYFVVEMFDLTGEKVFEANAHSSTREFVLPALANGVYCCQFTSRENKNSIVVIKE